MNETQKTVKLSQTSLAPGALLCLQCGKPVIQQSGHKKKFCSFRCRMDYWNSHPEQVYRRAYYGLQVLRQAIPELWECPSEILLSVLL